MPYRVGQVLYVILNKKMQVYPMMVIEEITKRTMRGEETNYVLQGGSDSSTTILLNQVDGEIFESPDEAKYVLINRATAQIEKIVDGAVVLAAEWYSSPSDNKHTSQEIMSLSSSSEPTEVKIELSDGIVANLKNFGLAG